MRISKDKVLFLHLYRLSQIEHDIPDPLTMEKIFVMLRVQKRKNEILKEGIYGKESVGSSDDIAASFGLSEYGE